MTILDKSQFEFDKMKLKELYYNVDENWPTVVDSDELNTVYGRALKIPTNEKLPYIYSSLVTSIDGKIAYLDDTQGPLIASKNELAPQGASIDWWTLNLLRSSSDGIIFGANTLTQEPDGTGHVYDQSLEDLRIKNGKHAVPWNIIPTFDGKDIPLNHKQIESGEIPLIIYTTHQSIDYLQTNLTRETNIINPDDINTIASGLDVNKVNILITGTDTIDNQLGMAHLFTLGVKRILCESPTVLHILLKEQLVNELFLNYSCVYVGGNSLSIGQHGAGFTSVSHPHTKLLSIYMKSDSFLYLRHKVIY